MFTKILIANRGEIACRVIKTAKRMGISTVAVYSSVDADALHVKLADEAFYIGAAQSIDSYLNGDKIIDVALLSGAEAIHPGYGFLSENTQFCERCATNGIIFIGPPASAIDAMGSKSQAKVIMEEAKVPLIQGYHGDDQSPEILRQAAVAIGFPVILKAVAGGGGKGMRVLWSEDEDEFDQVLETAKREAMNSFADDKMLVEKYLTEPRHIEIQLFCDSHGNGVYLFERDCSIQRRHQKVIEEAPAPSVTAELRQSMGEMALKCAQAIGYQGAGTVEFLVDSDYSFYFMEMNTRLQVEHPITEMITGLDLVEWQLRVAYGEELPLQQSQLIINGHAFEARIYAEDTDNDFLPATGCLSFLQTPRETRHVRIDSGVIQGDTISIYYDPMIAKLIVWDQNRNSALQRLYAALEHYLISGVTTNIGFLLALAKHPAFIENNFDTGFIEKHQAQLFQKPEINVTKYLCQVGFYLLQKQQQDYCNYALHSNDPYSPWHINDGWRVNQQANFNFSLAVLSGDKDVSESFDYSIDFTPAGIDCYQAMINGNCYQVSGGYNAKTNELDMIIDGHQSIVHLAQNGKTIDLFSRSSKFQCNIVEADLGIVDESEDSNALIAPMNGCVTKLQVEINSAVKQGDVLLVMEAMKMEYSINAPSDGSVEDFYYQQGDLVEGGVELLKFNFNNH